MTARRIIPWVVFFAAATGMGAQEAPAVLADAIETRLERLDGFTELHDSARRYSTSETSYYPSFVFPVEQSEVVIVGNIAVEPYLFDSLLDAIGTFTVIISGAPSSPSRNARSALESPLFDPATVHIMVTAGERTEWLAGDQEFVAPGWLIQAIVSQPAARVEVPVVRPFRRNETESEAGTVALLEAGVPAVSLHLARADAPDLTPIVAAVRNAFPLYRVADVNYAVLPAIRAEGQTRLIREAFLVGGVFAAIALLLLYAHVRPRRARRYAHAIGRRLPTIVAFFVVMTVGLMAANGILRLIAGETRVAANAAAFLVLKGSIAAFVVGVFFRLFRVRLASSTTVYAAGAIVLLVLAAIITATVSLPLSIYPISMLVGAFLFSLAPSAWLKSVLLAGTLLPPVYLLAGGTIGSPDFAALVVSQPLWTEPLVAVFVLPIFLMVLRLEYLTPRVAIIRVVSMTAVVALFLSAILVIVTISDTPVRATINETRSPDASRVVITPPPPPGTFLVGGDGTERLVACAGEPCVTTLPGVPRSFSLDVYSRQELNRTVLTVDIAFDQPARSLEIVVSSEGGAVLYRSDIPSRPTVGAESTRFTFLPGAAPPRSVQHEIAVIPGESAEALLVSAVAAFPDLSVDMVHPAGRVTVAAAAATEEITVTVPADG